MSPFKAEAATDCHELGWVGGMGRTEQGWLVKGKAAHCTGVARCVGSACERCRPAAWPPLPAQAVVVPKLKAQGLGWQLEGGWARAVASRLAAAPACACPLVCNSTCAFPACHPRPPQPYCAAPLPAPCRQVPRAPDVRAARRGAHACSTHVGGLRWAALAAAVCVVEKLPLFGHFCGRCVLLLQGTPAAARLPAPCHCIHQPCPALPLALLSTMPCPLLAHRRPDQRGGGGGRDAAPGQAAAVRGGDEERAGKHDGQGGAGEGTGSAH